MSKLGDEIQAFLKEDREETEQFKKLSPGVEERLRYTEYRVARMAVFLTHIARLLDERNPGS